MSANAFYRSVSITYPGKPPLVERISPHHTPLLAQSCQKSVDHCIASLHPHPGSDEALFSPRATRSQSPQADCPVSCHSLGIVFRVHDPSENILPASLGQTCFFVSSGRDAQKISTKLNRVPVRRYLSRESLAQ